MNSGPQEYTITSASYLNQRVLMHQISQPSSSHRIGHEKDSSTNHRLIDWIFYEPALGLVTRLAFTCSLLRTTVINGPVLINFLKKECSNFFGKKTKIVKQGFVERDSKNGFLVKSPIFLVTLGFG